MQEYLRDSGKTLPGELQDRYRQLEQEAQGNSKYGHVLTAMFAKEPPAPAPTHVVDDVPSPTFDDDGAPMDWDAPAGKSNTE